MAALVWGADRFVAGAAGIAAHRGISQLVIGITVVALGTSAPEIAVAIHACLEGNPLLAVGNAVGSNIANIGLVLAVTAIVVPLSFSLGVRAEELRWLLGATVLALVILVDLHLSAIDGLLLLAGLAYVVIRLFRQQRVVTADLEASLIYQSAEVPELSYRQYLILVSTGMLIVLVSADVLVWSATGVARWWGVSELVIGLTIVAIGTSLEEMAACVGAAIKGHADIAIGNVVGSNILNILTVMTVPALMSQPEIDLVVLVRDCGMMLLLTLTLAVFAYVMNKVITRVEGAIMLSAWIGYNIVVLLQATG